MPIYDYRCPNGHTTERLVSFARRDIPTACHCGATLDRQMHTVHCPPDGVYSYAPNLGSEENFARQHDEAKARGEILPKLD